MKLQVWQIGVLIFLFFLVFVTGFSIAWSIKEQEISELNEQIEDMKEYTIVKSAMMLSYAKGWEDGYGGYIGFGYIPLEIVREKQAIQFLKDKNIFNMQTSNYMMKALKRIVK